MRKIQFWADGCLSYSGWRDHCIRCGGKAYPLSKPDPDMGCMLCFGMGSSPADLAPLALIEERILHDIESLSARGIRAATITPARLKKIIALASGELRDHPESIEIMYALVDIQKIADFAADMGTTVNWCLV